MPKANSLLDLVVVSILTFYCLWCYSKVTRLEVYEVTNEGLEPILDVPLYGRIAGLEKFRPTSDGLDLIFVSTERNKFCVLGIDPDRKVVVTKSNGDLRDRVGPPADFGQLVFIDPESRMIGLHLYRGMLKVIPVNPKTGALQDAINLKLEELHVIDIKFLQGANPIVAVLYQDQREMRHVKTYEISVATKEMLEGSWSRPNVEVGASLLVPLPLPLGGVLLLAERSITYFNGDKSKSLAIKPMLIRAYAQLGPERLLFADHTGRLWLLLLSLSPDGKTLADFKLELLGEASTASALAYLDNNVLFLGSSFGDSQLIRLCPERDPSTGDYLQLLENYTNIGPIVDMTTVDIDRIDSSESAPQHMRETLALQNSSVGGPTAYNLFNASTMPTPASTHTQLVTCSGTFKDGSLRVIRNGIGISEHAQLDLEGILRIFALPFGEAPAVSSSMAVDASVPLPPEKLLFLSYVSETRLLKISGEELEEIVIPGSSLAEPTLLAAALSLPHLLVQVTPQAIYVIDSASKQQIEVWKPTGNQQRLSVAATHGDLIAVAAGSTLHIFKFNPASKKLENYCNPKTLSREISCVSLYGAYGSASESSMDVSHDQSAPSALFVGIGLWQENSVAIMSVEGDQLVEALKESMGGEMMARSVLFVTFEKSLIHMLVGMGDGSVNSYVFNPKVAKAISAGGSSEDPILSSRKRLMLGRQPVVLQSFYNKGKLNVLACGDRPTVIYGRHSKVVFAPLNLPHVVGVCELNTSEFPDALAFATKEALRIGSVEEIQRLHVRKIPVPGGEMARRIVHHPTQRAYVLATARYDVQDATGEETMTCAVQLLDEVSFELLDAYRLQPHECAESVAVVNFGGDSKSYVVVGTGFLLPTELEPSRGRVLIFEAETTMSSGSNFSSAAAAASSQQAVVKGKLKLVHEIEVKGMVWCAAPFMSGVSGSGASSQQSAVSAATSSAAAVPSVSSGKLLISVAYAIQLYSWVENRDGERELKLECEHTNHMQALAIATRGTLIYVGDLMRGSSLLQYRPVDSRLEQLALDLRPDNILSVGILDDHHFLAAENSLNLIAVQYANGGPNAGNASTSSSSAPSNPPQDPHTGTSVEQREFLQPIGYYHLGDQANCFRRGTLVLPNPDPEALALPSVLYATASGAIGVIASISKTLFDQLNTIQSVMAKQVRGIGGFDHGAWRSYTDRKKTSAATNFIDGDLIESILEFTPQEQEKIATAVNMTAQDLIKLVESVSQATH